MEQVKRLFAAKWIVFQQALLKGWGLLYGSNS
jgi:hypothetical protein